MPKRITCSGRVPVPAAGMAAFTPEGERCWVGSAWDPQYPGTDSTLRAGLVFQAAGATWVVTDAEGDRLRYARFTPGVRAGTVEVRRFSADAVEVTYDLTALSAEAEDDLRAFAEGFDAMLADWARALDAVGVS